MKSIESDTKKAIEEFFKDKVCTKCGEQATRFKRSKFYCYTHFMSPTLNEVKIYKLHTVK